MICPCLSQAIGRGIASIPASTKLPVRGNGHWQRSLGGSLEDRWQSGLLGATTRRLLQLGLPADHKGHKGETMGNLSIDLLNNEVSHTCVPHARFLARLFQYVRVFCVGLKLMLHWVSFHFLSNAFARTAVCNRSRMKCGLFMICPRLSQTMAGGIANIPVPTRPPVRGNDHWQRSLGRRAQGSLVKKTPRGNCAKAAVTWTSSRPRGP